MDQTRPEQPTAATRPLPAATGSASARRRAYLADAALVAVTLVWGSTFVVVKGALGGVGPFEFIALRFLFALLALALLFHRQVRRLGRQGRRAGAIIGVFLFAGYALQTAGLQYTTASAAAFLTGLCVLIVPLVAFVVLHQRLGSGVIIGVVLAPLGLWLLTADQRLATFGVGEVLVLGCALAFAAHIVSISAYAPRFDPLGLAVVQVGVVAILATLVALIAEHPGSSPPTAVWISALYTGLIGSAAVLAVQTAIQRFTTPTHAALIFSLEPVFAAGFAFALAGETLGSAGLAGGAILLAAMIVAELKR